jgi:hypothetical protein
MTSPGFSAEAALHRRSPLLQGPRSEARRGAAETGIVPQSYPAQCQGGGGYSKSECYGVVKVCQDCCQQYDPGSGLREVCGDRYVCGACFGFDF